MGIGMGYWAYLDNFNQKILGRFQILPIALLVHFVTLGLHLDTHVERSHPPTSYLFVL
jgi:hypothetical protein